MAAVQAILVFMALAFSSIQAGSISESFIKSFSSPGEKKDAIFEFSPVLENVLSTPGLNSLEGDERRTKIVSLMQDRTKVMQLPVMNAINSMGLGSKATPFWVANKIAVDDVPLSTLQILSAVPGPFTVRAAQTVKSFPIEEGPAFEAHSSTRGKRQTNNQTKYQWGVEKIGADIAINNGITGQGSVVGVIDTGARLSHVALRDNYRGGDYSWKDATNSTQTTPYDDNGHGTHCVGTAVGTQNGIGVAPGAKWIACKALDAKGSGGEKQLTACGQFMACPNNSTGNCTDYPNVVSNSWGGGFDKSFYNQVVKSWIALDIVPVFAIGNSGQFGCGSANSPGDQPNILSVGSTDPSDKVSDFSSRGPGGPLVLRRLFGPLKPEVAAPGRDIVSADYNSDTGYRKLSGTSMACPHVAGAVALLLSQEKMSYKEVINRLEKTASPRQPSLQGVLCPSFGNKQQPNNEYGYGIISMPKALNLASS